MSLLLLTRSRGKWASLLQMSLSTKSSFTIHDSLIQLGNAVLSLLAEIVLSVEFCKNGDANLKWVYGEEWMLKCPGLVHDAVRGFWPLSQKFAKCGDVCFWTTPRVVSHTSKAKSVLVHFSTENQTNITNRYN